VHVLVIIVNMDNMHGEKLKKYIYSPPPQKFKKLKNNLGKKIKTRQAIEKKKAK